MGCNCKKDKTELSKKKDIRKRAKEAIATAKRLWKEKHFMPDPLIRSQTDISTSSKEPPNSTTR